MVYQWKTTGLFKVDANVAGAEIERCRDADGYIAPGAVVARAADNDNALHPCFEWDNDTAAGKWREQQARVLICNLVTEYPSKEADAGPIVVRAFVHIASETVDGAKERGYKHIVGILSKEDETAYMMDRALAELRSFKAKYGKLVALTGVISAIEQLEALTETTAGNYLPPANLLPKTLIVSDKTYINQ